MSTSVSDSLAPSSKGSVSAASYGNAIRNAPRHRNSGTPSTIIVPDADDSVPVTTKKELWAYYLYFFGDTGVNTYLYAPIILQVLALSAGHVPGQPGTPCNIDDQEAPCAVHFGPVGDLNVSSVIIFTQGVSFLVLAVLCTCIGALADYGSYGRWMLIGATFISVIAQLVPLGITSPEQWWIMIIINVIISVTVGMTIILYTAVFPSLAANVPHVRTANSEALQAQAAYSSGYGDGASQEIVNEKTSMADTTVMFERNKISNISNAMLSLGYAVNSAVCLIPSLLLTTDGKYSSNVACAVTGIFMLVFALPWFLFQRRPPNPPLPRGENSFSIGTSQIKTAFKNIPKLPQTFLYILSYFALADAQTTTMSVALVIVGKHIFAICKDDQAWIGIWLSIFGVVEGFSGFLGYPSFYLVQKRFGLTTKTMYQFCNFALLLVPLWGTIGYFTSFGLHTFPEICFFFAYKFFINPFYAYSATMMSELIPDGHENLYFSIYGIVGKTSSFVGPVIVMAIVNSTGNDWSGFPFCLALTVLSIVLVQIVDVDKSKIECDRFLETERQRNSATDDESTATIVV